ncbi:MAG: prolyl oligopeptidase family serine peptidase [Bacteroidetes bacterium]|nr:prolyl oligopeptidase family serine peptidase [Bacteroidota bacterium]
MKKTELQIVVKIENNSHKTMNDKYLLYLPKDYDKDKSPSPLILFLHGAGERGNDIEIVKRHGYPKVIETGKDLSFVIISPQCKEELWWDSDELFTLLQEIISKYNIDTNRIYLTGLSMGGFGTWDLAIKHPGMFAAIAPICGGGDPSKVCAIKNLPVWVFHGAKDQVVPIKRSVEMVEALEACGGNPKFSVFPEAAHDSWTQAYNNPKLYEWFLEHKKEN